MKILQILSLLFLSFLSSKSIHAQVLPLDSATKKVIFHEVVTLDTLSKDVLFERSSEWFANYYKTTKFDVNDRNNGKIGTEGYFVVSLTYDFKYKSENNVSYQLLLTIAEGKYKYTMSDFSIYSVKTGPKSSQPIESAFGKMTTQNKKEFLTQLNTQVKLILDDLKNTLATGEIKPTEVWK